MVNAAMGTNSRARDNDVVSAIAGNTFSTIFYGSARGTTNSMGANVPSTIDAAMGNTLTYGRRTTDILSLNLAGRGGAPVALGLTAGTFRAGIAVTGRALSLGLSVPARLAIDAVLFTAEAGHCYEKTKGHP